MRDGLTVRVRTKNADRKTITSCADASECQPCNGNGYIASRTLAGAFDTCRTCKGRGVIVRNEAPLPQIEW